MEIDPGTSPKVKQTKTPTILRQQAFFEVIRHHPESFAFQ
jgi:hypothetical protein